MLFWAFKVFFFSIFIIYLCHTLIDIFKNTLTVPKTKDLINSSSNKYSEILSIIQSDTPVKYMNSLQNNNDLISNNFIYQTPQDNLISPINNSDYNFNQTNNSNSINNNSNLNQQELNEHNKIRDELSNCLINALKN